MKPTIGVVYVPGTNCHEETISAVEYVGGQAKLVILQEVIEGTGHLTDYQALIFPGGFSWGDHLGAGRIEGIVLMSRCRDELQNLVGKIPILGICNGFQVLVETGLLPDGQIGTRKIALLQNSSARFESRWVRLLFSDTNCLFIQGLADHVLRMPVAHGEGRLYRPDGTAIQPVCYYVDKDGQPTMKYPSNPNGSPDAIAGLCDEAGLIFGLMPHPERAIQEWHGSTDGQLIFRNLINYLKA